MPSENQLRVQSSSNVSNSSSTSTDVQTAQDLNLKGQLLEKYMQENEGLRSENAQLHQQREILIHDHELVCRENERLQKKRVNSADILKRVSVGLPDSLSSKDHDNNNNNKGTPEEVKDVQTEKSIKESNGHNNDILEIRGTSAISVSRIRRK